MNEDRDKKATILPSPPTDTPLVLDYAKPERSQSLVQSIISGEPIYFGAAGFLFGFWLLLIEVCVAKTDEAIQFAIGLISSPLGLFQNTAIALLGTPLVWATLFALAGSSHK